MKRTFIFALILLAAFSKVNAFTAFAECLLDDPNTVALYVKINPDPVVPGKTVEVTLSGKLKVDVPAEPNIVIEVAFLNPYHELIAEISTAVFCRASNINCPLKAGTEFSTVTIVGVPNDLGKGTTMVVDIFSPEFLACSESGPIS
jgi:hypothetical protein